MQIRAATQTTEKQLVGIILKLGKIVEQLFGRIERGKQMPYSDARQSLMD